MIAPGRSGSDYPWRPFVENWAGDEFAQFVDFLDTEVNRIAAEASDTERARMEEIFEMTTRYEIAFWEMAHRGPQWPGM